MRNDENIKNGREQVLDEARVCVCGHRKDDYGSPEDSFGVIAKFWNIYLTGKPGRADPRIDAQDVAMMMGLLKVARIATGTGTHDSFVDLAGYAACGGEIADAMRTPPGTENMEAFGGGAEASVTIEGAICGKPQIADSLEELVEAVNAHLTPDGDPDFTVIEFARVLNDYAGKAPAEAEDETRAEDETESWYAIRVSDSFYGLRPNLLVGHFGVGAFDVVEFDCQSKTFPLTESIRKAWAQMETIPLSSDTRFVYRVWREEGAVAEATPDTAVSDALLPPPEFNMAEECYEKLFDAMRNAQMPKLWAEMTLSAVRENINRVTRGETSSCYADLLQALPINARLRRSSLTTDETMFFAPTEELANALANMLEALGHDIVTGYYDPKADAASGETDAYTGLWYVDING